MEKMIDSATMTLVIDFDLRYEPFGTKISSRLQWWVPPDILPVGDFCVYCGGSVAGR